MIINIPIEPIPMRYSCDWQEWFVEYFNKNIINYASITGKEITKGIERGRFLDCIGTNYYKSSQLMQILHAIHNKIINDGDILFLHDLWFPGIEQIKYTCDAMNIDIKIMGCLHAGAYDPNDFLYQQNMGRWAVHFEHMLFALVDKIFVATKFHKDLVLKSRAVDPNKIKVTGFPIKPKKVTTTVKKNQIIFTHRHNPEKNPDIFYKLAFKHGAEFPGWKWVTTKDVTEKSEYYRMMEESKISISLADQETWGIAMQESVFAGCYPLVPNKLSYKEMYHGSFKFDDILEIPHKIRIFIANEKVHQDLLERQHRILAKKGEDAFSNIMGHLADRKGWT